jgi:hypothetical protein
MSEKLTKAMIDDLASAMDNRSIDIEHSHHNKFIVEGNYLSKLIDAARSAQSGWSCPRCSRIYGPSVQICVPCNTAVAVKEVT